MSAIEQIYEELALVFGGTNPNQCFTMLMPSTNLNPNTYRYDTSQLKPDLVKRAESELVDQMFDIARLSGSSNGQKLSSQYLQALSVLVPNFDPKMSARKKEVYDILNMPVPEGALLGGKPYSGTLKDYYFALLEEWTMVKQAWEQKMYEKKESLKKENPATANEEFGEWYDMISEGELAKVNAAMGKLVATFPPSEMNAILDVLESGPGSELDEAANLAHNMRMASPNGGYFYPVELVPKDWFLDLKSDEDLVNLLKDPEFIADALRVKRQGLMSGISHVQVIISRMSLEEQIYLGAPNLADAQSAYSKTQVEFINQYSENALIAAEIYLSKNPDEKDASATDEVNEYIDKVNEKKRSDNPKSILNAEEVQKILAGQKVLMGKQVELVRCFREVAKRAMSKVGLAAHFPDLPVWLARLQSQLNQINDLRLQLAMSSSQPNSEPKELGLTYDGLIAPLITAAGTSTAEHTASAAKTDVKEKAATEALNTQAGIAAADAAQAARVAIGNRIDEKSKVLLPANPDPSTIRAAVALLKEFITTDLKIASTDIIHTTANGKGLDTPDKIATAVKAAIEADITNVRKSAALSAIDPRLLSVLANVDKVADASARKDVADAISGVSAHPSNNQEPKNYNVSNHYTELKLSFSSSDMQKSNFEVNSSSQASWGVNQFFGSASGKHSNSDALNHDSAFDSSSEIQVTFKAAKIDIRRDWFNPGIFKKSGDMSRLSNKKIAKKRESDIFQTNNDTILPAFPVAFVVAKDISLSFKASENSLDAVHSMIDSVATVGGRFLCFKASHSSSSHTDLSKMSSKTQGQVVTINIPGPQILGWFLELTPEDKSKKMDPATKPKYGKITIVEYVKQIKAT